MWRLYLFYASMNACFQFPEIPLRIWCLEKLKLSPATYGLVVTSAGIPWACKPIIGAIVDTINRKRLSIVIAAFLNVSPWFFISNGMVKNALQAAVCITTSSAALCFMDITCDAIMVKHVRNESMQDLGVLQSNCWISRAIGAIVACAVAGYAASHADVGQMQSIIGYTGLVALPGTFALITEVQQWPPEENENMCTKLRNVGRAILSRDLLKPCLFIFALCAIPNCGNTLSAFFQTKLHFNPTQFAIIDAVGHIAHGAGATLYKKKLRKMSYRVIFKWGIVAGIVLQALQLLMITRVSSKAGIPDLAFALMEAMSGAVVGQVLIMPICVIAATRCPGGVEGTLYSAVMAITNLGTVVGMAAGSAVTEGMGVTSQDYSHMWAVALLCVGLSTFPLGFLRWIDVEKRSEIEMTPVALGCTVSDVEPTCGTRAGFVDEPLGDADGTEDVTTR